MTDPYVNTYLIHLCDDCVEGMASHGEACHTSGCAMHLNAAPYFPLEPPLCARVEKDNRWGGPVMLPGSG